MRKRKYSLRDIAKALNRSVSTLSEEISNNSVNGEYDPKKANHKAYVRRQNSKFQGMKIALDKDLKKFVEEHLYDDQSPEIIAGRIKKHEKHLERTSKDSIYRYIKSVHGRKIETFLKSLKTKRRGRPKSKSRLTDRTFIDKRPKYIQNRKRIGDAEADFIVSGKTGKGILLVLADRKSRAVFMEQIMLITTKQVLLALRRIKRRFLELKTLTLDNDLLFQKHKELERKLGIKIYFCHPYKFWQKGQVENTNKRIRRYIPKSSNISFFSRSFIYNLEQKLNRRPMECLKFKQPSEMLEETRRKNKRPRRRHLA